MSLRVLLVEDDPILASGVAMVLRDEGFVVEVSLAGRPVVGLIAHFRPDAVVLDISLPDIDGVLIAQTLRRVWPELPIVFATGHNAESYRRALLLRRTAVLQKPYEMADLVGALRLLTR